MAIGKKRAAKDSTQKAKKAKKADDSSKKSNDHKRKGSLLKTFLPGILGSTLATIAVVAGLYFLFILKTGGETQAAFARAKAHGYIHTFSQQALSFNALLTSTAASDRLKTPTIAEDLETLETIERSLEQELPDVSNVEIYLRNKARKDNSTNPPISFAQLDLINRAEKGEEPSPEIHPHGKERFLTLAAAIKDGNKVLGSIFATFNLKTITDHLPPVENTWGYLELTQQFGNNDKLVFFSAGNKSARNNQAQAIDGPITHWQASFYPSIATNIPARNGEFFYGLGGALIILVVFFSVLSYLLLKRALNQNATKLARTFNALTSHEKHANTYSLEIFTSLAQTIERLFTEYDSHLRHQALKNRDVQTSDSKDSIDVDPMFQKDDVLDIDINDDDSSLFEGDTSSDPLAFEDEELPDTMDMDVVEMADSGGDTPLVATTAPQSMPDEIFRAYDIRGKVGDNLTENTAQSIGMAIGSEAIAQGQTGIIVARDGRTTSNAIAEALVNGLMATGIKVIDIGMLPTPVMYYATKTLDTQSGVMVTGSHNPPEYNGFKVVIADKTLAGDEIQALKHRIENGDFSSGEGSYETFDIAQDYCERILNDVVLAKPMKIVIDCGNGVAGTLATDILNNLGCSVTTLFGDVDGNFPNHHPDPGNPDNLATLISTVQEQGAELGIAFDGDGDRIGVVTGSGKIIWPDRLLMLYARDLLSRNPGSDIIYDVKCSRDVAELVSNLGGRAIMNATGHSLMKAKMAETGAAVGGELSGHIFFNDRWYGFDDAIYSAARLLEVLSMEPVGVEDVFAEFPEKVSTPEITIPVGEDKKFSLMDRLAEQGQFSDGNMVTLDGIRVDYPDGWGLVRASNTTPNLVARFEAETEESLERIKTIFRDQLKAVDATLDVTF